ncbi:hypothetical protein ES703_13645 [subsurface metagenome]
MKKILIASLVFIVLVLIYLSCQKGNDGWYDDGSKYLCNECKDIYVSELVPCEYCNKNPTPYRLCYECAKKLNQCQFCRKRRF